MGYMFRIVLLFPGIFGWYVRLQLPEFVSLPTTGTAEWGEKVILRCPVIIFFMIYAYMRENYVIPGILGNKDIRYTPGIVQTPSEKGERILV